MYEVDELANIVPMAGVKEQEALTLDIKKNGQREAAVLWQNKIVDGRCRQLACMTLGIELKVRVLDSNLSRDEVAMVVKSLNTRRNLTPTQKVISAMMDQERTGSTNDECAAAWAIGVTTLKNAKYIKTHKSDMIPKLFDGKTVAIVDVDKGIEVTTNKVNTLARLIKKAKEYGKVDIDVSCEVEFTVDGLIHTEAGKNWYYSTVAALGITDIGVRMLLIELANLKFKKIEE